MIYILHFCKVYVNSIFSGSTSNVAIFSPSHCMVDLFKLSCGRLCISQCIGKFDLAQGTWEWPSSLASNFQFNKLFASAFSIPLGVSFFFGWGRGMVKFQPLG